MVSNSAWNLAHFRWPVIQALLAAGVEVVAAAPVDGSETKLRNAGLRFFDLPMKAGAISPLSDVRMLVQILSLIRRTRPDAIATFTIKPNIYGGIAARLLATPSFPTISGLGSVMMKEGLARNIAKGMFRAAFRRCQRVFFQNNDDRLLFENMGLVRPGQAALVAGSGVDLDHFSMSPLSADTKLTFLMIGRLLADKGCYELADAIRILRREGRDFRVVLLGSASSDNPSAIPRQQLSAWVEEGLFQHQDHVDDVRPWIEKSHCVILPSYREGLPRSLLEGAAMGRPLIATDVPGCRDVVNHHSNGLLCAERSSADLAHAMRLIIEKERGELQQMGAKSREIVERRFSHHQVAETYLRELVR